MLRLMRQHKKETYYLWIALFLLLLYVSPLFILKEDAHIRVHDNLDSNIAWYKVLADSGEIIGRVDAAIPQIINGLPRDAFGTELSGIVWLHAFFSSMTAYAVSQTITRVVAFWNVCAAEETCNSGAKSGFHPNWRIAGICLNTFLAFGNAEYAWISFGTVGFFKYPKRG